MSEEHTEGVWQEFIALAVMSVAMAGSFAAQTWAETAMILVIFVAAFAYLLNRIRLNEVPS